MHRPKGGVMKKKGRSLKRYQFKKEGMAAQKKKNAPENNARNKSMPSAQVPPDLRSV